MRGRSIHRDSFTTKLIDDYLVLLPFYSGLNKIIYCTRSFEMRLKIHNFVEIRSAYGIVRRYKTCSSVYKMGRR